MWLGEGRRADRLGGERNNHQTTKRRREQNSNPLAHANTKSAPGPVPIELPLLEVLLQTKAEFEAFAAQAGLKIIRAVLDAEIDPRCGEHGKQTAYRHGAQPGCIVFAGRKVPRQKPRLRQKHGPELTPQS